jgi:hypothetical protein
MGINKIRVDPLEMEAGDLIVTDGRMSLELGDVLLACASCLISRLPESGKRHPFIDGEAWGITGVCCLV